MIPVWASIDFDFDQQKIKDELLSNNVFEKSMVATTDYNEKGHSRWDPNGDIFPEVIFEKNKHIPHYVQENGERKLVKGEYNTFQMLNLTYLPEKEKSQKEIVFTIPKTDFHGYVSIQDNSLAYDNSFYFSISKPQKSNVIAVGNSTKNNFLSRIYTAEEFNFTATELNTLNYNAIEDADEIILNELPEYNLYN